MYSGGVGGTRGRRRGEGDGGGEGVGCFEGKDVGVFGGLGEGGGLSFSQPYAWSSWLGKKGLTMLKMLMTGILISRVGLGWNRLVDMTALMESRDHLWLRRSV